MENKLAQFCCNFIKSMVKLINFIVKTINFSINMPKGRNKDMTKRMLRRIITEAQEKGEKGIFVWTTWDIYSDYAGQIRPGNNEYEKAFSKIREGKDSVVYLEEMGLTFPVLVAIPISELLSEEGLQQLFQTCEKHCKGPITLVPSNELSDSFR